MDTQPTYPKHILFRRFSRKRVYITLMSGEKRNMPEETFDRAVVAGLLIVVNRPKYRLMRRVRDAIQANTDRFTGEAPCVRAPQGGAI